MGVELVGKGTRSRQRSVPTTKPRAGICQAQTPVVPCGFVTMFIVMSNITFKPNYAGVFIILSSAMALGYLRNFTDE